MTEDKKDEKGGVPRLYWRFIAAFFAASIVIYGWNFFFNPNGPSRITINYTQFIEQLNTGNIKSVSLKKETARTGTIIRAPIS